MQAYLLPCEWAPAPHLHARSWSALNWHLRAGTRRSIRQHAPAVWAHFRGGPGQCRLQPRRLNIVLPPGPCVTLHIAHARVVSMCSTHTDAASDCTDDTSMIAPHEVYLRPAVMRLVTSTEGC